MANSSALIHKIRNRFEINRANLQVEDDSRVNGSPIYLETIGYKLKNRIYHKIEQVLRDFRKIVNNSKLYHKVHVVELFINLHDKEFHEIILTNSFTIFQFRTILIASQKSRCSQKSSKNSSRNISPTGTLKTLPRARETPTVRAMSREANRRKNKARNQRRVDWHRRRKKTLPLWRKMKIDWKTACACSRFAVLI